MNEVIKTFTNFGYNVTVVETQHHIVKLSLQNEKCTIIGVVVPSTLQYCIFSKTLPRNEFLDILEYAREIIKQNKVVFVTTTDGIQYDLIINGKTVSMTPTPLFASDIKCFLEEE